MRKSIKLLLCLALAALAGCASLANQSKDKARDETLENYAATLRWGDFSTAFEFVDPAARDKHPLDRAALARYARVEVGEYDAQTPMATGANTIEQIAHISLIDKASQGAYEIVDRQNWRYDPVAKRWWLESGLPDVTPPPRQ